MTIYALIIHPTLSRQRREKMIIKQTKNLLTPASRDIKLSCQELGMSLESVNYLILLRTKKRVTLWTHIDEGLRMATMS